MLGIPNKVRWMFIKIVNLVVDAICDTSGGRKDIEDAESCESKGRIGCVQNHRVEAVELNGGCSGLSQERGGRESQGASFETKRSVGTDDYRQVQNGAGKSHKSGYAKSAESSGGNLGVFGAFHYMNTRAEEVNFGSSVAHGWVKGVSLKVKDFCSKPQMVIVLALLPFLYMVSPKAVVLVPLLVALGAAALVVQSFLPVYIGLDFSLMGAVLGSVLFHPWIGVLCVFCTYVVAMMFPSGHQDALEYERIFLFFVSCAHHSFYPC